MIVPVRTSVNSIAYSRKLTLIAILAGFSLFFHPGTSKAEGAFLKSANLLNGETRGYCLDVFGHTPNIRVDAPLRMHSCKYGENQDDQVFEWLGNGQIGLPILGGCLAAESYDLGAQLYINECDDKSEEQLWTIADLGEISPASNPELCITISEDYHLAGAPPWISPGYYARESNLQLCDKTDSTFQQFRWGDINEQTRSHADTLGREMPFELAAQIRGLVANGGGPHDTAALYADQPRMYELAEIDVSHNHRYGPNARHRLDIHTDIHRYGEELMPVVMFFHGGGFVAGNRAGVGNVADYFASLGLVGINATYRLAPEVKYPAGSEDIASAVSWVQENIADYGGDPDQVYVIGESAAAFHVATYAFRQDVMGADAPSVAGVILLSGTYGANTNKPGNNLISYFGEDLSTWEDISVLGNIQEVDIPVLLSITDYDNATAKASYVALAEELTTEHNAMPRMIQLIGHNHFSPTFSIGTQDTQLSAEILQLIRSTAGAYR